MSDRPKLRVAIIYYMWPHYRRSLMQALEKSENIEFTFYGSGKSFQGIEHVDTVSVRHFIMARLLYFRGKMWQPTGIRVAASGVYDAIIYLGDPNVISTWIGAALAHIRKTPIIFWGHGWMRPEAMVKKTLRRMFYSLADHFFVYATRSKRLGVMNDVSPERITVVYNSLDLDVADDVVRRIEAEGVNDTRPQALFVHQDRPLLICSARITRLCRFDLLLDAAALLAKRERPVNILLVGNGPERQTLADQARSLGVDVYFYGSCYDENITGQMIYWADLTVSPGKVGLTAVHSLMYGTPVITHGDLDWQMPEADAIDPGRTGVFFVRNDAASLADTIMEWLDTAPDRDRVRAACRHIVREKWNSQIQAEIIERALLKILQKDKDMVRDR